MKMRTAHEAYEFLYIAFSGDFSALGIHFTSTNNE